MFDNLNITKGYKLQDNITGNEVEIATFNALLTKGSNINVFMNINYPNLYEVHKDNILMAYREFNSEVSALACTMGLAIEANQASTLRKLEPLRGEFKDMAIKVFSDVIASLGDIQVNPVPVMDIQRY
nr:MAG TPA: hypothetical protein [Caudoviricetes sp.]